MSISKKLLNHLERCNIRYEVVPHKKVFTAFDLATTLDEDLARVAKTVLARADRDLVFVSVPANARLDFLKLKKVLGVKKVSLAPEAAVKHLKIKNGTTHPFASLYKRTCVLDRGLAKCRTIICRAGSYTESLECSVRDFVNAEHPIVAAVSEQRRRSREASKARPKRTTGKRGTTKRRAKRKRR